MGFRSFDLDELSQEKGSDHAERSGYPGDLDARRKAASMQDAVDADRWEDDGGSVVGEVALKW
jgi:hypothetical protein